ncbi:hypothetical protein BWQ96_10299 [Gracilariopsis chorda]|uniref:Uncharacterized protein n=1 Tax=Gracilariopsis chorda TaxID=448386 RepID=A0A2V3ID35_9FLOR|nr:hypothetical protein BWQ96_10299 [Gracilariopsis chorda]|eukprot:PXF39994.1 hypothetical protein BWQ96_10299 [Gracilariopsis chorda]
MTFFALLLNFCLCFFLASSSTSEGRPIQVPERLKPLGYPPETVGYLQKPVSLENSCKCESTSSNPTCHLASDSCQKTHEAICSTSGECSCTCQPAFTNIGFEPEKYSFFAAYRQARAPSPLVLNIIVDRSAARNINAQRLNLGVSKGFASSGDQSFNTVWMFEPYTSLQTSTIQYRWVEEYRATFTTKVEIGEIIRTQDIINSPDFNMGQSVSFDGVEWSPPVSDRKPPNIGVAYKVDTNALHPVLLASYTMNGQKKWRPFYYGVSVISGNTLVGFPVIKLQIQLGTAIKDSAFVGSIIGNSLEVDYGATVAQTVCVYSRERETTVRLKSGRC